MMNILDEIKKQDLSIGDLFTDAEIKNYAGDNFAVQEIFDCYEMQVALIEDGFTVIEI